MKAIQFNKFNLEVGTKIEVYYSNGERANDATVTRITESSCFLSNCGGHRESWNTVNNLIEKGNYKISK